MTTMENLSLVHSTTNYTAVKTVYEDTFVMFWGLVTFYICLAVVTVIGNSLVIYAAHVHRDNDISKSLALAIKSLAVADMLYGLLGAPFQIYGYYLGKYMVLYILFKMPNILLCNMIFHLGFIKFKNMF